MKVSVLALKNWCTESITPLAWQRVVIKTLPDLRDNGGFSLEQLEDPDQSVEFKDKEISVINGALKDLYDLNIPDKILS